MYALLFVIWIMFNGRIDLHVILFGLIICSVMYLFEMKFIGLRFGYEKKIFKSLIGIIAYLFNLLIEVVKANLDTARIILNFEEEPEPCLVQFTTPIDSSKAHVVLANSITLTPGTITVDVNSKGEFVVHALDKSLAKGIDESGFVEKLKVLEDKVHEEAEA